ncbi:uncharacterized protein KQ657_003757 [Scheffersomyces spartinae]|uniref:Uncharacterized protein n=1 Tax=Scheffersomyces spartinae TaxID=45513 RepID=A0A9P7VCZ3_9ASCO|nr:uncharacterized protein KQ657_003757 [Scheffersomyces spartinae]KAG7195231.1 hypothetical protein KQ657_003757 [Scheffersomyces spartinae]
MSAVNKKFFEDFTSIPIRDQSLPNHFDAGEVIHIALNFTGTRLAYSRSDGSVRIWSMMNEGGRESVVIESPHTKPVELLCFNPQEEFVFLTVARDEYIRVWRTNGVLQREVQVKSPVNKSGKGSDKANVILQHVGYSSDGQIVVVADREGWIYGFDALFAPIFSVDVGEYVYSIMWFHFEHKYFACGLQDGSIPIFELVEKSSEHQLLYEIRKLTTLRGHRSSVTCLAIDPRGIYFAAGSNEGVVLIWKNETMLVTRVISDIDEAVTDLDISRDGTYVAVSFDRTASGKIYDISLGDKIYDIPNSLSGSQVTPQIRWFPQKTTFVYVGDKGRNVVLMKRPEEGLRKRADDKMGRLGDGDGVKGRDIRDSRTNKDHRENRDKRITRESRESRESRDNRDRDIRHRDKDTQKRRLHHQRY